MAGVTETDYRVAVHQLISGFDGEVIPSLFHTVRIDTGLTLGVVGKNYKVKQNEDVFKRAAGFGNLEAEGVIRQGAIAYQVRSMRLSTHHIRPYALVVNSFDGKTPRNRVYPLAELVNGTKDASRHASFVVNCGVDLHDKDALSSLEVSLGSFDDLLHLHKAHFLDIFERFERFDNLSVRQTRKEPNLNAARLYSRWFGAAAGLKRAEWAGICNTYERG